MDTRRWILLVLVAYGLGFSTAGALLTHSRLKSRADTSWLRNAPRSASEIFTSALVEPVPAGTRTVYPPLILRSLCIANACLVDAPLIRNFFPRLEEPKYAGARVSLVVEQGFWDQAGIDSDDVILRFDGRPIDGDAAMQDLANRLMRGERTSLLVQDPSGSDRTVLIPGVAAEE